MKACSCCASVKPLGDFFTYKASADGHTAKCKCCLVAYMRARRERAAAAKGRVLRTYRPRVPGGMSAAERYRRKMETSGTRIAERQKRNAAELRDCYVRALLKQYGLDPTPEAIEAKRAALVAKRARLKLGIRLNSPRSEERKRKEAASHKEWARRNAEKVKRYQKTSRQRADKGRARERNRTQTRELSDTYLRRLIGRDMGGVAMVPATLVDAKRAFLKIQRFLRENDHA